MSKKYFFQWIISQKIFRLIKSPYFRYQFRSNFSFLQDILWSSWVRCRWRKIVSHVRDETLINFIYIWKHMLPPHTNTHIFRYIYCYFPSDINLWSPCKTRSPITRFCPSSVKFLHVYVILIGDIQYLHRMHVNYNASLYNNNENNNNKNNNKNGNNDNSIHNLIIERLNKM